MFKIAIGGVITYLFFKGWSAWSTKVAGENLNVEFSKVKILQPSGGKINLEVYLKFTNPTSGLLKIENVDLDLSIEGKKIGHIQEAAIVTIPAKGFYTGAYRFQSENWTNLTSTFFNLLLGGSFPDKVTLKGAITANSFTTDFNTDLPISNE